MSNGTLVSNKNKDAKLAMRQNYVAPAVDIYELDTGLMLVADVPGVNSERLKIDIDQGLLTLEAEAQVDHRGDKLFSEFSPSGYYRQFRLPEHLELTKVDAQLADGVLTLTMPKAATAQPQRIEVKTVH